ncbi:hypothetical protein Airi02_039380 [Actinoallomurus iriomotensis]|uniref:Uncharacterized protein n=1 Tax=Actinoallomurus iriomotensis TaxID=478107 RepID=A0A9W6S2R2_9ACTN|nr:hypothetical protein Airi02_039380 [Actinoallomurus iriomotensis]
MEDRIATPVPRSSLGVPALKGSPGLKSRKHIDTAADRITKTARLRTPEYLRPQLMPTLRSRPPATSSAIKDNRSD